MQARDGILTAINALDPADVPLAWKGFAKRGMGEEAKAPPSSSVNFTGWWRTSTCPAGA